MNTRRISLTEGVLYFLVTFSVFTVLQSINVFDAVNKVLIAGLAAFLLPRMLTYRYNKRELLILVITLLLHIVAIFYTTTPLRSINLLFYFLLWVLVYLFFARSKEQILQVMQKKESFIDAVLWIWTLLIGVAAVLPSSYVNRYFFPYGCNSFRLMPTALIIAALAMYRAISQGKAQYNLFLILPTFAAFMNRSRTYFAVYLLFMLMYVYMIIRKKRNFYLLLVPVSVVVMSLMSITGIADKINDSQYTDKSYFDFWGTITSGRSMFWQWDLEAFFDLPFLQQFVGNGFSFVYDVNGKHMNEIWAHNDIINLLMNFGYIGVYIYLWTYIYLVKKFFPKGNRIPLLVKILFHSAVFVNSMFNMSYTYLCAMISYPLFLSAISAKYECKAD